MERFWDKTTPITETGCIIWTASVMSNGYGAFKKILGPKGNMEGAHRVAWELTYGPIPDGLLVCHKCDTKTCVNPSHLFQGTHDDNMADMKNKNRQPKGEQKANAKLSDKDVEEIRSNYDPKLIKQEQMAKQYGIRQGTVSRIINNKRRVA